MNVRGLSNSREVIVLSFSSVEPGVVKAPDFAGGLAGCEELSVPLKEVTRMQNCGLHRWWSGIFVLVRVPWLLGVLLLCSCVATRLCV